MNSPRLHPPIHIRTQRGAVLFVALVFLVLLTLLGIAASSSSILQERMTGGLRSQQLGLLGAESAMRGGEFVVWSAALNASLSAGGDAMPPCAGGGSGSGAFFGGTSACTYDRPNGVEHTYVTKFRSSKTWAMDDVLDAVALTQGFVQYVPAVSGLTGTGATASIASQPRYILEDLGLDTSGNGGVKGRMGGARLQELGGAAGAPPRRLYRVTARSQGGSDTGAVQVVESVYSAYGTNHQSNPDAAPTPPSP